MKPLIGMSTKAVIKRSWYKDLPKDLKALEINRRTAEFPVFMPKIKRIIPYLDGIDISLHSGTYRLFSDEPIFAEHELAMLKAEILLAKKVGVKEIVFHFKYEKPVQKDFELLKEVVDFAEKNNIILCYESGISCNANQALLILEKFPYLKYNLDIAHLHIAITQGTFDYDLDKFLEQVKDRIVYVHVHNNNGEKDEHNSIRNGTMDWKNILSKINFDKVKKIIIEVRTVEDYEESKKELEEFLNNA